MSIKINARETNVKIGKNPGFYYVMTPELYIALTKDKVIKEAALRSGVSKVLPRAWVMDHFKKSPSSISLP